MPTVRKPAATARKGGVREQSAQATRETLLKAAIKVFGKQGLNGARVEQISRAAKSHDRMIYYYFGSKEALFVAVIEETYRRFNEAEARLALDLSQPVQALRDVIAFMWGYYQKHPEFITLLNSENLHRGRHIGKSSKAGEYSSPALEVLSRVLGSGVQAGLFRPELRARDVYLMIASMGYFYLSNRYTLSTFLGESLEDPAALAQWQQFITDAVLRTVLVTVPPATP
ncbi:MAG: TetR family transcriptional regulator [Rubrivivax sp.]|jgi:TetR/AcrR family transcriptional regulator, upper aerobic nicotinate degradation pathway regulator|nr:TetR family transcriptional regulator [Rubrivivax sp.]